MQFTEFVIGEMTRQAMLYALQQRDSGRGSAQVGKIAAVSDPPVCAGRRAESPSEPMKGRPFGKASTEFWSILRSSGIIFSGDKWVMALKAVELAQEVPADDFQALEEKVYRTIEMYKAARQAQVVAERDTQRLRQQMDEREEQIETLRRETVQLRKDRETIRSRVEKMLEQIESIAEEQAS